MNNIIPTEKLSKSLKESFEILVNNGDIQKDIEEPKDNFSYKRVHLIDWIDNKGKEVQVQIKIIRDKDEFITPFQEVTNYTVKWEDFKLNK